VYISLLYSAFAADWPIIIQSHYYLPEELIRPLSLWQLSLVVIGKSGFPRNMIMLLYINWISYITSHDYFNQWLSCATTKWFTHSLADSDFHGHRPAVCMNQHLLWDLDERIVWHRNATSGSSRIASSAYQKWPTKNFHSRPWFN